MAEQDSLLFWLEQEPVESDADIYMPPDTPIQHQNSKIAFQINKKQEVKKQRAIERLKLYHFEKLEELRERFAKSVIPSKLPGSEYKEILEVTPTDKFFEEQFPDIFKLLEDLNKINKDNEQTIIPELFAEKEKPKLSEEESERLKMKLEFKADYEKVLMESYLEKENELLNQYTSALTVFKQNKENEQPYTAIDSFTTPLPTFVTTNNTRH